MDADSILEIQDLYTNFYTKGGTVYALDGVNLKLKRGETLGLVGESGCGKSVTANSILRLVPSPPGKIEGGKIMFSMPPGLVVQFERLMSIEASKGKDDPETVKARLEYEEALQSSDQVISTVRSRYDSYRQLEAQKGLDDPEVVSLRQGIFHGLGEVNILELPQADLQRIRGKVISMIFQEPMASLNPVFTAGDQIAEVIILHEKSDLAAAVLERLELKKKLISSPNKAKMVQADDGVLHCSSCGETVTESSGFCPKCEAAFPVSHMPLFTPLWMSFLTGVYTRMKNNPNDGDLKFYAKIPLLRRYQKPMKEEALARAVAMLRLVRVPDPENVSSSFPYELSGGMQQRVMIAMALACKPQILIADEPTTALDVTIQAQILKLMRELQEDTGTTILMITHNLGVIAEICDRVGVMYAGNIVELAPNHDIFKEPLHPYTQGLLSAIPRIDRELPRLETIEGNVPNLAKPPTGCRFHPRCPYAMEVCSKEKPMLTEIHAGHMVACHLYREVKV